MEKYVRVMDGIKSNAGNFEYKLDIINVSNNWNPNEKEPDKIGGFNFSSEGHPNAAVLFFLYPSD